MVVINVVTAAIYASDKRAARRGARRTPENTLFLLNLAGGPKQGLGNAGLTPTTLNAPTAARIPINQGFALAAAPVLLSVMLELVGMQATDDDPAARYDHMLALIEQGFRKPDAVRRDSSTG